MTRSLADGPGTYARVGAWCQIRIPREGDYDFVLSNIIDGDLPWMWRGYPPSVENAQRGFWEGQLAQWIILDMAGERRIGHVLFYGANPTSQFCSVQAWIVPELRKTAWPLEGIVLAIDVVFRQYGMRKIYIETAGPLLKQYEAIAQLDEIRQEGVLRQHLFMDGDYQDLHYFAIYREDWPQLLGRLGWAPTA